MASRLVLVLGDLFIPDRAPDIPAKVRPHHPTPSHSIPLHPPMPLLHLPKFPCLSYPQTSTPAQNPFLHPPSSLTTRPRPQFKKLLTPNKVSQILCLGNLTSPSTYTYLRSLAPDLQITRGDFDTDTTSLSLSSTASPSAAASSSSAISTSTSSLPISKVVTHGSLRIGFCHGHTIIPPGDPDSLLIAARHMDVDVLLWGGTHRFEAYEMEGKFFVNPGSATGALGTGWWGEDEE
ncbi:MAG: hypothetical protein LQ340_007589, partial [Diploschistes diacapsis]